MPVSCGVSREHSSDLALLWLWCWPVATTPIQALAWELPYAKGVALKRQKTKKKKKKKTFISQKGEHVIIPKVYGLFNFAKKFLLDEQFLHWLEHSQNRFTNHFLFLCGAYNRLTSYT